VCYKVGDTFFHTFHVEIGLLPEERLLSPVRDCFLSHWSLSCLISLDYLEWRFVRQLVMWYPLLLPFQLCGQLSETVK